MLPSSASHVFWLSYFPRGTLETLKRVHDSTYQAALVPALDRPVVAEVAPVLSPPISNLTDGGTFRLVTCLPILLLAFLCCGQISSSTKNAYIVLEDMIAHSTAVSCATSLALLKRHIFTFLGAC